MNNKCDSKKVVLTIVKIIAFLAFMNLIGFMIGKGIHKAMKMHKKHSHHKIGGCHCHEDEGCNCEDEDATDDCDGYCNDDDDDDTETDLPDTTSECHCKEGEGCTCEDASKVEEKKPE